MDMVTVKITFNVKRDTIFSLLVSALEGGSNYWYSNIEPLKRTSKARTSSDRFYNDLMDNGFTIVDELADGGPKTYTVKPQAIQKALRFMSQKYTRYFDHIISDNSDATTGDVFLQSMVLGDVIYG